MVDSNNVEIRYSLRPMSSYDVTTVWLKLEWFYCKRYTRSPWYPFASTCWCVDAVVSCIIQWNLRQWININNFSFMNQMFDHHWCEIMSECRAW